MTLLSDWMSLHLFVIRRLGMLLQNTGNIRGSSRIHFYKKVNFVKNVTRFCPDSDDLWHAETSVCARFGVGTSCGMPPTFFRHTRVVSRFLQHIAKRTSQGLVQANLSAQLKDLVTPYPAQGGHDWRCQANPTLHVWATVVFRFL